MAIEEPKYAVSIHEGAYEVRDYRAAIAAEVSVTVDQTAAARKGFRLLAGYIFGGNRRHQSIAMTAASCPGTHRRKNRHDGARDPNPIGRRVGRSIHDARRLFARDAPRTERSKGQTKNRCSGSLRGYPVFWAREQSKSRSQDG